MFSFLPGLLLGTVIGLSLGVILVVKVPSVGKVAGNPLVASNDVSVKDDVSKCEGVFEDLSVATDGNKHKILMGEKVLKEISFSGPYNHGPFYKKNIGSEFAYLNFSPDGLGGYILYSIIPEVVRVNICSGQVDRLLSFNDTVAQEEAKELLDISFDDKYIALRMHDLNGVSLLIDSLAGEMGQGTAYRFPDDSYTAIDAKFSPDGSKIAVVGAVGNPMSEQGILWIFDMKIRKFTSYKGDDSIKSTPGSAWVLNGWLDNETVDVESDLIN